MSRAMVFNFFGYAGWDVLLTILPKKWQTRRVARAWLKSLMLASGATPNLHETPLILQMPWASYRIVDLTGKVERCNREHLQI